MEKFVAKNFYKLIFLLIIVNPVIFSFFHLEKSLKLLFIVITLILFFIFYIIHDKAFSEINSKVLNIQYIMENNLNKKLSDEELDKIYKKEYNKYFNLGD